MPAQLISRVAGPRAASASFTARSTAARSVTSAGAAKALPPADFDLVRNPFKVVTGARHQRDGRTVCREAFRDGPAETTPGAGDDRDLAGERIHAQPQTSRAVSTTSSSLRHCSSSASALPSSVEAKPHCGLRHSCSSGAIFRRLVDAALEIVLLLDLPGLRGHKAEHDGLALRAETAAARIHPRGRCPIP